MSSVTSLTVRCPACGAAVATGGLAPGSRVVCGACRRPLYVPMPAMPGSSPGSSRRMPLPPQLRGQGGPAGAMAPVPVAPAPAAPMVQIKAAEDQSPPAPRHWIYDWLLMGGLALGALVAFAFVIALIISGGIVARRRGAGEHLEQVVVLEQDAQEKWTNAAEHAQMVQKVSVKVDFFEFGPVMTRDERGMPGPVDDQSYLQVMVKVKNNTKELLEYHGWYGNQFELDGEIQEAELVDDRGRQYPRKVFEGVSSLRGLTDHQVLEPKESLTDVLVFSVPEGASLEEAEYFRLKLPCGSVGKVGWFRLELPASMLRQ